MLRPCEPVHERNAGGMFTLDVNDAAGLDCQGDRQFRLDREILRPLKAPGSDKCERPARSPRNEGSRD